MKTFIKRLLGLEEKMLRRAYYKDAIADANGRVIKVVKVEEYEVIYHHFWSWQLPYKFRQEEAGE